LKNSNQEQNNSSFFLKGNNGIGVLLLHGWSSPPDELFPIAEYLHSFGYSVSVPALRGHGTRPEDLLGVTWNDWLDDTRKALDDLKNNCTKIFVGGISMGGNLAILLAEDDLVSGIITMGAAMKFKFHSLAKAALFFMGLTKTYRRKYYPPWARKKMGKRNVYMYYPIESAKEVQRLAEATRIFLPKVKKPILIMQSTTDFLVANRSPQIIFDQVKSREKEIFWIKDAYHVFAGERVVWEKVGEFIAKVIKDKH
jgi:carboxylesterase